MAGDARGDTSPPREGDHRRPITIRGGRIRGSIPGVAPSTASRQPRIGLIAVRAGEHRRGIARALLSHVLGTLHRSGIATASAEVDESNRAALTLFDGVGGRRMSSALELAR